jgi:hypothetical protein
MEVDMRWNGKVVVQSVLVAAGAALIVPSVHQVFGSDAADAAARSRRIVGELRPVAFGGAAASVAELHRRGWVECDGGTLAQSEFPELYGAIGDTWGQAQKGAFRVPDLRRVMLRGIPTDRNREIEKELLGADYVVGRPGTPGERTRPEHAEVTYFIYVGREIGGAANARS